MKPGLFRVKVACSVSLYGLLFGTAAAGLTVHLSNDVGGTAGPCAGH
jgi:hypothetical protein